MGVERHACPGRCGRTVPLNLLSCSKCWWRLPDEMRRAIRIAYGRRKLDPIGHRDLVIEAYRWYHDNPIVRA